MCGIVGYISKKTFNEEIITAMNLAIKKRGPDGMGYFFDNINNKQIALGHRRLSVRDLSLNGSQPMKSSDDDIVLIYNGEIYNSDEIKLKLLENGHVFKSNSDTEVLLNAYIEWGIDSVRMFNGMFAYAILDKKLEKLFLVRDRMGEKPLYYTIINGDIIFGSELSALMNFPDFNRDIDLNSLNSYLWQMYIPAPSTIFKNTQKLESGNYLCYDIKTETIIKKVYWSIDEFYLKYDEKMKSNYIDNIEKTLLKSIEKRFISDVPLGIFLSGGIDSTIVTTLAKKVLNYQVETFSIGFLEKDYDEAKKAKEIAKFLGTKHHELYFTEEDAKKIILDLPRVYSEPMSDNSQIAMLVLSKFTREKVTVALSGDGGDELFYGYPSYKNVYRNKKFKKISTFFKPISGLLNKLLPFSSVTWKINKIAVCRNEKAWFDQDFYASSIIRKNLFLDKSNLNSDSISINKLQKKGTLDERILNLGLKDSLQEGMLNKVDRASMFYSLESRTPFLDHDLVELSQKITPDMKYVKDISKYPLKQILNKYLPKEYIDNSKKGFGIPLNKWLHNDFSDLIKDYFSESMISKQKIFYYEAIKKFLEAFNKNNNVALDRIMWSLLVFQMWWKHYFD